MIINNVDAMQTIKFQNATSFVPTPVHEFLKFLKVAYNVLLSYSCKVYFSLFCCFQ